ncbi:hypothetical protein FRB94_013489 [Tulasnella sp. JGI-2019a]|nr:hypothetical protein FRB94_013489 [Tulasnella sp. JGI-2019a]
MVTADPVIIGAQLNEVFEFDQQLLEHHLFGVSRSAGRRSPSKYFPAASERFEKDRTAEAASL